MKTLGWSAFIISLLVIASLAFAFEAAQPATFPVSLPFSHGEALTYQISWEAVPAGQARLLAEQTGEGWRFTLTARTNKAIDLVYKVRDRVVSRTDPEVELSLGYEKTQREGSYHRDITVAFDWDRLQSQRFRSGELKNTLTLLPGTMDPLSMFYRFRRMELAPETELLAPVTDGEKMVLARARVLRRETVEVPAGVFDCWVVEPDIQDLGGVFKKSPDAAVHIWVTADELALPVRVKSRVVVGSFYADLLEREVL